MSMSLLIALVPLALWVVLALTAPVITSTANLLFALGVTLLVRWWALRA